MPLKWLILLLSCVAKLANAKYTLDVRAAGDLASIREMVKTGMWSRIPAENLPFQTCTECMAKMLELVSRIRLDQVRLW